MHVARAQSVKFQKKLEKSCVCFTARHPLVSQGMNTIALRWFRGWRVVYSLALMAMLLGAGCAGNRYERSTGETIDDNATTFRVKNALGDDPIYKYPDVTVTTFKGRVQLGGFVNTQEQKSKAEDITRKVEGVKDVTNAIVLK